jgi:ATP synthase protein I
MTASYGSVVRRSAVLTSAVAAVMIGICAGVAGAKGVYGALVGIGIVAAFFGISILAVGRAAKVSPMVMMGVAMATYIVKIIAFMVIVRLLENVTVFNAKLLGLTAIVLILAWSIAQVVTMMRTRMLYVTPEEEK